MTVLFMMVMGTTVESHGECWWWYVWLTLWHSCCNRKCRQKRGLWWLPLLISSLTPSQNLCVPNTSYFHHHHFAIIPHHQRHQHHVMWDFLGDGMMMFVQLDGDGDVDGFCSSQVRISKDILVKVHEPSAAKNKELLDRFRETLSGDGHLMMPIAMMVMVVWWWWWQRSWWFCYLWWWMCGADNA